MTWSTPVNIFQNVRSTNYNCLHKLCNKVRTVLQSHIITEISSLQQFASLWIFLLYMVTVCFALLYSLMWLEFATLLMTATVTEHISFNRFLFPGSNTISLIHGLRGSGGEITGVYRPLALGTKLRPGVNRGLPWSGEHHPWLWLLRFIFFVNIFLFCCLSETKRGMPVFPYHTV